jgi:aminopeptidase N
VFSLAGCRAEREPINGSAGIGDSYYPQLGNGGYDVQKYTLDLDIDPSANDLRARETIAAQATERLKSLDLDFQGMAIDSVRVNGATAIYERQERELIITPALPLVPGMTFSIEISYHGHPEAGKSITSPDWVGLVGWFHNADGSITTVNEPNGAALWFPVNDHPRDKATYRFDVRVPQPWVVAAPGVLRHTINDEGYTRYIWEMDQPMASYLASINIDKFVPETAQGPGGLIIRSYFPPGLPDRIKGRATALPAMIEYFTSLFGPYPFDEYGVLVVGEEYCKSHTLAEEVQSMSVYCPESFDEQLLVHELAHQWFGDSVSLEDWQALWLKEGMATYAEWLWSTRDSGLDELNAVYITPRLSRSYSVPTGKPEVADLYAYREIYEGGALVFHALRLEVGDKVFFQVLRTYLEEYRFNNASTADFIAVAEKVSGRNLSASFDAWLMEKKPPDMPGRSK